jgi:hypothetical protein
MFGSIYIYKRVCCFKIKNKKNDACNLCYVNHHKYVVTRAVIFLVFKHGIRITFLCLIFLSPTGGARGQMISFAHL